MPAGRARWRVRPGPLLDPDQKDWVSRGGSLTAHLAQLGPVSVRVVRETIAAAWPDESACLRSIDTGAGMHDRAPHALRVWTREVLLSVGDVPCVAAHSVTPVAHSHGVWKSMRMLRTRPLADLLYHDRAVRRSALVSRRLAARRAYSRMDPLAGLPPTADRGRAEAGDRSPRRYPVVARRSLFERRGAPLLITECFLPDLWPLLANRRLAY
ncbi:chorismate lyase [Robbsia sp. Bb-Pol-6]|uniref:Probable chorismate pyruvate-lyase n=2 Tax=Robbsia betulipollinis TaxID=2981849 RepID=A0ABT3ZPU8_9BURK|nr:chorismate lyase [Robbsia betulipollinis]MCY0388591.1 chorismate lyase [Robbsia betulipollinis]